MNLIDAAILLLLAITTLGGYYRGFFSTALSIAASVVSWVIGRVTVPLISGAIQSNEKLFNTMCYYTEGAEYVAITDVELTRTPINAVSGETLRTVIANADMPRPMGAFVSKNIATEAFAKSGVTTLGDYFNQTIVCVVINILAVLLVFVALRIILGLVIGGASYGLGGYPVLQRYDGLIGAGLGLINGILLLFVLFMAVPILLTVLPKLYEFLSESFFGAFFYNANPFISMIPST